MGKTQAHMAIISNAKRVLYILVQIARRRCDQQWIHDQHFDDCQTFDRVRIGKDETQRVGDDVANDTIGHYGQ